MRKTGTISSTTSESQNLPAPEVIAQEIVEDLQAALEPFRLIAGDLNRANATGK